MKVSVPLRVNKIDRMNSADSPQLITECIAGKEEAIECFVRRYESGVFKLALSILDDPADAYEVTQETFLSALRCLSSYRERTSLKAWLYTIALNHSRSHLRKRKTLERLRHAVTLVFQTHIDGSRTTEDIILQNEKEAVLWNEVNHLDEHQRITVILRYFHELSVAEISDILKVNEGTIHSRLHYARERLRQALKSLHGEG